tara:strand:+ start:293 stop:478 length:186 start_codon:yes stop_codon:yes gene_type:complete
MGNRKVIDKIKICKSFFNMSDKLLLGINPPEDMVVKAKLKESTSLRSIILYKNITKTVEKK